MSFWCGSCLCQGTACTISDIVIGSKQHNISLILVQKLNLVFNVFILIRGNFCTQLSVRHTGGKGILERLGTFALNFVRVEKIQYFCLVFR